MSLSLGDILEEKIQGVILMRGGRSQMGSGGDGPGVGSLGWFWVVAPATCWVIVIVTRIIPSRTAFFMAYVVISMHVVSMFN